MQLLVIVLIVVLSVGFAITAAFSYYHYESLRDQDQIVDQILVAIVDEIQTSNVDTNINTI